MKFIFIIKLCSTDDEVSCSTGEGTSDSSQGALPTNATNSQLLTNSSTRLSFKDPDIFLPTEISEQLLYSLCERKKLSDLVITLFDSKTTRLR